MSIGIAVITHAAKQHLKHCLGPLLESPLSPRILVVNSSSNDGTVEEAERLGAELLIIPRREFNHGATRERARRHLGTDIVVMMTPDAYPTEPQMLERLVAPLLAGKASVAYARQLPRKGAGFLESFGRSFNYPSKSHIRSLDEVKHWGVYSFFCSNSCAAYLNRALDEVGGFPTILTAEDTFAVAKLLRSGHRIAYVAEAAVSHSHDYTLLEEFRRYFDTGFVRKRHADWIDFGVTDETRGWNYFQTLLRQLSRERPQLLPYALAHTAMRWLGYKLGRRAQRLPRRLLKRLSAQPQYWDSL